MNHKKILIKTLIVSLIIWILLYFIGSYYRLFVIYCKEGSRCFGQFGNYLTYSIFLLPIIFLLVLGTNYLLEYLITKLHSR
ncbi:MAG: hypothetical protein WC413_03075 [Candidatus Nanoarchaeia archaeon]